MRHFHRLCGVRPSALGAGAAVVQVPVKSNLELNPDEMSTVSVEATEPTEIGWPSVQAARCTTNGVQTYRGWSASDARSVRHGMPIARPAVRVRPLAVGDGRGVRA